ncbi:hypothetical protein SAMN04488047_12730 [Tranquillimonas alkanivorans]|uniref:Uncharacterized protein n=1 Tax=Tranquillimonas alkanivorans TaxID=441119 RepID=A0A1I5V5R2_9RHOB|nr:hypothetical protein SAMN04488047_12730 [Tranquillimonas alkanivorans]
MVRGQDKTQRLFHEQKITTFGGKSNAVLT